MKNKQKTIKFVVGSAIHITDPCYSKGTWCGLWDLPAQSGQWVVNVETDKESGRISMITAIHHKSADMDWTAKDIEEHKITVDSGACGIFDKSIYPKGETGEYDNHKSLYGKVCALMDKAEKRNTLFGVIGKKGFVSESGYGDGTYNVFLYTIHGVTRGVRIRYI